MSEWISPAACQAVRPRRRCQDWAGLSSPAVKKAIRSSSENAPWTTRWRPDSEIPSSSRIDAASSSSSSDSSASSRAEIATAPASRAAACSATIGGDLVVALVDVGHVEHRLGGQRAQVARGVRRLLRQRHRAHGPAGLQRRDRLAQPRLLGDQGAVAAARVAHDPRVPALGLLEVGVDQLGLDRVHVRGRVDLAVGVDHVRVLGARARRAAARRSRGCWPGTGCPAPRPCARPPPARRCRGTRSCPARCSTSARSRDDVVEALVLHPDDGDVRLDRRERVVGGLRARLRERVEERGLAGVRHPDDAHLHHRPKLPSSVPSPAPAATSDG